MQQVITFWEPVMKTKIAVTTLAAAVIAAIAPAAQAQQKVTPPIAIYWMSIDTASGMPMGGAGGGGPSMMDIGRMSVIKDPGGAVFAVWQPVKHQGSGIVGVEGTWCWSELMTRDAEACKTFYTKVFGWVANTLPMGPMQYTMFNLGDKQVGGMMEMMPEMEGIPPNWGIYWKVDNIEASTQKVRDLGGSVMCGVEEAMGVGRFSMCKDPQGAAFAMIQLNA